MKIVSIGIQRDRGFSSDVPLHFTDMPLGVTLEPIAPIIKEWRIECSSDVEHIGRGCVRRILCGGLW